MNGTIILDFDSTFISVETLDTLAQIAYKGQANYSEVTQRIAKLTQMTMAGQISLHEALVERVQNLKLTKDHVELCIELLHSKITPSFEKHKDFIQTYNDQIYIFSGGFFEVIAPVVARYGIKPSHIYANEFVYDNHETIININPNKLMAHGDGKSKQLELLNLSGPTYVLGDGSTDAIMKNTGLVDKFYLFAENVYRETVAPQADIIIKSFDEFLKDIEA